MNDIGIKGIMITISSIFSIKDISFVSSQQESSRYDILQAGNQRWGNFRTILDFAPLSIGFTPNLDI